MRALLTAALLLPLAACGSAERPDADAVAEAAEGEARDAIDRMDLDLGDLSLARDVRGEPVERIVTRDGGIELGLTDSVLYVRLSEATRKQVAEEMEAEMGDRDGLGGRIARAVTDAVQSGMDTAAQVPLSDVRDIRVEGGTLVIEMADGEPSPFDGSQTDGRPTLEQFDPADAERIARAFDAATGG